MKYPVKQIRVLVLIFSCFFSQGVFAQTNAGALQRYFTTLAANEDFNGNVLVAENGKIVYQESFGYANLSANKLNALNTSFAIASITKTMTSTAILQLQEKKKLLINDNYIKYFPSFPYPTVTIRQLLSHTSCIPSAGFYRFLDSLRKINKDTFYTNADVIPALVAMKQPLICQPVEGDRAFFSYSNLNYYLLAMLIEKLSGLSYGRYLEKNIFLPAGMEHTGFSEFYFGWDPNQCKEQRWRYMYSEKTERIDTVAELAYIFSTYNFKGHGDVVSTVGDLLKYDQALYNGTLLKESSLQQAFHPLVPPIVSSSGYGLGWSILNDSSKGKVVNHHGGGIGIEAMFVRNLAKHQTIILFDNNKNPAFDKAITALKILNGEKISLPGKSVARAYGRVLVKQGIPAARALLAKMQKDSLHYKFDDYEMNLLAYQLMWNNIDDLALEVFQTDIDLFPDNWNSYDSYGEILVKLDRKDEAIKMYQRSIELNPRNEGGKKALEQLKKDINK
jgi:CubicO group peptidase (beta-lactamase class C family)